MLSVEAELRAEVGSSANGAKSGPAPRPVSAGESVFDLAKRVETRRILDRYGIAHDGKHADCPGCGEPKALVCADGGVKCLHDRCSQAGPAAHRGFRSNVDIVAERERLDPKEAAKTICGWFGIAVPERKQPAPAEPVSKAESTPVDELVTLVSLIGPALDRAERRRLGDEKPIPVPFRGWADALGGGLWPGAHVVVSGTGLGKSQLTIQTALGAAMAGIPSLYVGLELDAMQIALRVVGARIGMRWSRLYYGHCSDQELARARGVTGELNVPFYYDAGPPRGWPVSRLYSLAQAARKRHAQGPLLVVLDYLQLVGSDTLPGERAADLRQRIGDAAYVVRDVATRFDAAVVMISSAARNHNGLLAGDVAEAGFVSRHFPGSSEPVRTIAQPHVLVGLGKESGDIEFSADTVTTLIKWPEPLDNGERAILVAVPKVRAGFERWSALAFDGGRFTELPIQSLDELPEVVRKKRHQVESVSADELDARILDTVRRLPDLRSATAIANATTGTKGTLIKRTKELFDAGRLVWIDGCARTGSSEPNRSEGANR